MIHWALPGTPDLSAFQPLGAGISDGSYLLSLDLGGGAYLNRFHQGSMTLLLEVQIGSTLDYGFFSTTDLTQQAPWAEASTAPDTAYWSSWTAPGGYSYDPSLVIGGTANIATDGVFEFSDTGGFNSGTSATPEPATDSLLIAGLLGGLLLSMGRIRKALRG